MTEDYLRVFRAFTDANRVRVLELLCDGEQCACVLLEDLKISQPTLSHHMKILCKSGIVKSRRVGPWNYYTIDAEGCEYASRLLDIVARKKLHTTLEVMRKLHRLLRLPRVFKRKPPIGETPVSDSAVCCCAKQ